MDPALEIRWDSKEETKKMKRKKQKKSKIRKWTRVHAIFTISMFVAYVVLGSFGDTSLLARDIQAKYAWAQTSISVEVLALPNQPVVTAQSQCMENEQAVVGLDWGMTAATDYYDILRDGEMLAGGITETGYVDQNVEVGTSYSYEVIAQGPLGSVLSDPVSVEVAECLPPPPLPAPICEINSFEFSSVVEDAIPQTKDRQPFFAGTTNMPNALIEIRIFSSPVISGSTYANSSGYWEFATPVSLSIGSHHIEITAIDPLDQSRTANEYLYFEIIPEDEEGDEDEDDDEDEDKKETDGKGSLISTIDLSSKDDGSDFLNQAEEKEEQSQAVTEIFKGIPIIFRVEVLNKNKTIYADQDVVVNLIFEKQRLPDDKIDITYEILDIAGNVISKSIKKEESFANKLEQKISLPKDMGFGKYTLRIQTKVDGIVATAEDVFSYSETPLINLGGSIKMTYSELVSNVGWLALISLVLLLLGIKFVIVHEYILYRKAIMHITEKGLRKKGLISKRKEVSR